MKRIERKIYPLRLEVTGDIGKGITKSTRSSKEIMQAHGAIRIVIEIDSGFYPKEEVYESVKETALQAIECFR